MANAKASLNYASRLCVYVALKYVNVYLYLAIASYRCCCCTYVKHYSVESVWGVLFAFGIAK